mgnify:CR=1 FL=1|tara:strand:- start:514 stop:975 length:462 start_codon:yes stop_codon:yes gene_type:complete
MYACTTTYIEMGACIPSKLGGFSGAKLGWRTGVCTTEEIVWCEANGHQHPDCATAYCRAEEIRLSLDNGKLSDYDGVPVYPCSELDRLQQFVDDMEARDSGNHRYACVPRGDKRSFYLPQCDSTRAAVVGEFYTNRSQVSVRYPSGTWELDAF